MTCTCSHQMLLHQQAGLYVRALLSSNVMAALLARSARTRGMTAAACVTSGLWPLLTLSWLLVLSHLPPFYLPFLFKWSGYQTSTKTACHKRKRCQGTVKCHVLFVCFFVAVLALLACILSPSSPHVCMLLDLPLFSRSDLLSLDLHNGTRLSLKRLD